MVKIVNPPSYDTLRFVFVTNSNRDKKLRRSKKKSLIRASADYIIKVESDEDGIWWMGEYVEANIDIFFFVNNEKFHVK